MKRTLIFLAAHLMLSCATGQRETETIHIRSKVFNEDRSIKVWLPEEYKDYPNRTYAVAYLFDAQSDAFFNFIKATVDYLTSDGYISPLILIGIVSTNRQFELTPKAQTKEGMKYFQKSGGADTLSLLLKDEVMPLAQQKYRCANFNIGIGHSLGATFLTYSAIAYPELFKGYIAISPNYDYDKQQLVHAFENLAHAATLSNKFLYIAYGKGDMYEEKFRPGIQKVDSILTRKNIPNLLWQVKSLDNDSHGTTATEGIFKGLIALYRKLTLPYERFTGILNDSTKSFVEQVKDYYGKQSVWAGVKLPLINDLNGMAYNCLYSGRTKEAIAVLQWGLTLYPDDINLHDSMGEIQQSAGSPKEALRYYTRGLEIVEQCRSRLEPGTYQRFINGFKERIKSLDANH